MLRQHPRQAELQLMQIYFAEIETSGWSSDGSRRPAGTTNHLATYGSASVSAAVRPPRCHRRNPLIVLVWEAAVEVRLELW